MPLPLRELLQIIIGAVLSDVLRWLWRVDDAYHPRTWTTYCAWCGLIYTTEAAEAPADDTPPPGWHSAPGVGVWCSLRCWVEHARADAQVPPPLPVVPGEAVERIRRRPPANDIEAARAKREAGLPHVVARQLCLDCGEGADGKLLAVYPASADPTTLECPACGGCRSEVTPVDDVAGPPT